MPRCTKCGTHVTVQFARVFGDNENTVRGCMACVPNAELGGGTDATDRHAAPHNWPQ